jgi:formylglycine-generating enzyme required for sulfatase activity
MKVKRRKFLQYAGLGSVGLVFADLERAIASALSEAAGSQDLKLETFSFSVATLDANGQINQQQRHTAKFFPELLTDDGIGNAEKLEMVAIASGQFEMGASRNEVSQEAVKTDYEFPRHRVQLPSFYMSKHPITQSQWAVVADLPKVKRDLDPSPAHFRGGDLPVESVSWLDAVEFCDRLTAKTGRKYQLPSEAQWEYACRAGTYTPFNTGETITSEMADYVGTYTYNAEVAGEYRKSTTPVGKFSHNAFGLQDMHGNVWEWSADSWHSDYRGSPTNGEARINTYQSGMRTVRGGGWLDNPSKIRSASRSGYLETELNRTIGFRVVTV